MIVLGAKRAGGMPAFVTSALTQAIGVVSRLGGRMYFNPVGFDPYAFLNSDGSGGISNAPGQLVGAALDLSGGMGAGPELVADPEFNNPVAWTLVQPTGGGSVSISGGRLTIDTPTGSFAGASANPNLSAVVGLTYLVTMTIVSASAGGVRVDFGGTTGAQVNTAGQYTLYVTATTTGALNINRGGALAGTTAVVENISVRAVPSPLTNAATQAILASKPMLAAGPTPSFLAMSFDGDNDRIFTGNLAATAQEVMIVSASVSNIGVNGEICSRWAGSLGAGAFVLRHNGANAQAQYHDGTSIQAIAGGTISANQTFTLTGVKGVSSVYARFNGVQNGVFVGTPAAQSAACPFSLGNSGFNFALPGNIFFAAHIPSAPTAAELAILERAAGVCSGQVTS